MRANDGRSTDSAAPELWYSPTGFDPMPEVLASPPVDSTRPAVGSLLPLSVQRHAEPGAAPS